MTWRRITRDAPVLPAPPARIFLVGLGGIGMSGLAQLLHFQGYEVAGSDRRIWGVGKDDLFSKLAALGISIFPQDGHGIGDWSPETVVVSAAVEDTNPDLRASSRVPRLHRARALADALNRVDACQVAVAGSCGKTTVTGWLSSALRALGRRVVLVDGGFVTEFETDVLPGNVHWDPRPDVVVYEVDESDRSLTEFQPDVGVLLNVGTDHYDRDELLRIFGRFLDRCRDAAVVPDVLLDSMAAYGPPRRTVFAGPASATSQTTPRTVAALSVRASREGTSFHTALHGPVRTSQFGDHSVLNGCAVLATLDVVADDKSATERGEALGAFLGVRQRFEYMGSTAGAVPVYNDYAHNVEKIEAAIHTARGVAGDRLLIVFQPHGFKPLAFMRTPLRGMLQRTLSPGDRLLLLPVFYAGGTTAFSPTSEEVAGSYAAAGLAVRAVKDRAEAQSALSAAGGFSSGRAGTVRPSAVLVLGARDPSLRAWCRSMVAPPDGPNPDQAVPATPPARRPRP